MAVVLPHPHDVLMAKLERMDVKDREHVVAILAEFPLSEGGLALLEREMPHRQSNFAVDRIASFDRGLAELRVLIARR